MDLNLSFSSNQVYVTGMRNTAPEGICVLIHVKRSNYTCVTNLRSMEFLPHKYAIYFLFGIAGSSAFLFEKNHFRGVSKNTVISSCPLQRHFRAVPDR